ncbi:hypothetical protein K2Y11_18340 [bacterium]|nr:hypothetical protein [bacterium]
MSLSSLFFFGCCWGCYRLGRFNERFPGRAKEMAEVAWQKLYRWLTTS